MDRNGSKMQKLWMKQCCRDLYVINYRLRGLSGKNFKTQKIVLANTEKFRVRSKKYHGWGWIEKMQ
jgi:hypothetical protein